MTNIFLQARSNSTRLPGKAFMNIEGYYAFELAARRLNNTGIPVIICTSDGETDDLLCAVAADKDLNLFRGDLDDVLGRFANAAVDLPDDAVIIRATADNLFPDGEFVNVLLDEFKERQLPYLYANSSESDLPDGLKVELFRKKDLIEANEKAVTSYEREHVTPYIISTYGAECSKHWKGSGFGNLRGSMDTLEDYLRIARIFHEIKEDPLSVSYLTLCSKLKEINDEAR